MKVIPPVRLLPAMLSGLADETAAAAPDYSHVTTYGIGDIIKDPATWLVYQSRVPANTGNDPSGSPDYWQQIGIHEVAYDPLANYLASVAGAPVYSVYLHRIYQCISACLGKTPLTEPTFWKDYGPTNAFAMFDTSRNTATVARVALTADGLLGTEGGDVLGIEGGGLLGTEEVDGFFGLSVVITPGRRVNAIALLGVVADSATISVTSGGLPAYNRSVSFFARVGEPTSWSEYFYNGFKQIAAIAFFDLPLYGNNVITVTFRRVVGNVSVGAIVVGKYVDLGLTAEKS